MNGFKAAIMLALAASAACTPTVTLRSGPDFAAARALAEGYCAAIATPSPDDEAELFGSELRRLYLAADAARRQRLLSSAGTTEPCVPRRVRAFGPPPHIISIDAQVALGGATDALHLRRESADWRIDDLVYARPRRDGAPRGYGLKMALRALAD